MTGLPGAGKSTVAGAVAQRLTAAGRAVEVLDGDQVRRGLSADLGFSKQDRENHVRRVGFVAALLARHGVVALVPVIAPYRDSRAEVRTHHDECGARYLEVYVATPLDECSRRDPKGLYAQAAAGSLSGLTGVDDPYEPPAAPELFLDTSRVHVAAAAERVLALLPG